MKILLNSVTTKDILSQFVVSINQTRLSCYMTSFSLRFIICIHTLLTWHHSFRHSSSWHVVKLDLFFNNCKIIYFLSFLTQMIIDLTLAYFSSFNMPSAHFLINTNICFASVLPIAYLCYVYTHYFIHELYSFCLYNIYSFVCFIICYFDLLFYIVSSFLVLVFFFASW